MGTDTEKTPENLSAKNELTEFWDDKLGQVARSMRKWYPEVPVDDCHQDLRLWFMVNKWVAGYLRDDEAGKLLISAKRQAVTFCRNDRQAILGPAVDEYRYSVKVLRSLLPSVWDYRDWTPGAPLGDEIRAKNPANEGGNLVAMLCDVKEALTQVRDEDFLLLMQVFRLNLAEEALAEAEDVDVTVIRSRVQRALTRLRNTLGRRSAPEPHEGPGARQAMSNAAAIAGTRE